MLVAEGGAALGLRCSRLWLSCRKNYPFSNTVLQRRAAKHFGTHMVYRCVLYSTLSAGIESTEFRKEEPLHSSTEEKEWETRTKSRSEMPVWTVSQKFCHLQWVRVFGELWSRPTTTADFGSPFWQIPYASNLCLLEDKIQDRGMYLFTTSYGICAVEQRSWDARFSGWIKIFVIFPEGFKCPILKHSMRGLLQHWTESSIIPTSKEESDWRNERPRSRTVSFAVDRLLTWSTITSGSLGAMILSRIMSTSSLLVFEITMFRNSIKIGTEFHCLWRKSRMMTSWKDCTN